MSIDELEQFGLVRMDDAEIRSFLASQGTGVLGFPTADAPYLLPMSYGFDGESRLYFTYLVSSESRKATLSERTDVASMLVYKADTKFNWQSGACHRKRHVRSSRVWKVCPAQPQPCKT